MNPPRRFILLVLDGVGAGDAPDAAAFGDAGANTLGNLSRRVGGLRLPTLQSLGLGNVLDLQGVPPVEHPGASWGRMLEKSQGKDSTLGHWELAGLVTARALPVYPRGFPEELVQAFCEACGIPGVLGNKAASGTEIIAELGAEHLHSGKPILYTSADSVFQIAAHEERLPLEELYRICRVARDLLVGEHAVARVIARPFVGVEGAFERTTNRRDFSLKPHGPIVLEAAREAGIEVVAIGKIDDLYAGTGIDRSLKSKNNDEGFGLLCEELRQPARQEQFLLLNLVDFDVLWGHRLDPRGFAGGLETFDRQLPQLLELLRPGDVLCMTADHGNDPTGSNTDHTRESVPLLVVEPGREARSLGTRESFTDMAASVVSHFGLPASFSGNSFLD